MNDMTMKNLAGTSMTEVMNRILPCRRDIYSGATIILNDCHGSYKLVSEEGVGSRYETVSDEDVARAMQTNRAWTTSLYGYQPDTRTLGQGKEEFSKAIYASSLRATFLHLGVDDERLDTIEETILACLKPTNASGPSDERAYSSAAIYYNMPHLNARTVEDNIEDIRYFSDFLNPSEEARARELDQLWQVQIYPYTPISFWCWAASSLEAIIAELPQYAYDGS